MISFPALCYFPSVLPWLSTSQASSESARHRDAENHPDELDFADSIKPEKAILESPF
ncbi:MAG: hypothetical protein HGB11_08145 [Chlorobiales bacterium]|nr:hypothetical protein [Chlorobiales bacterium]